MKWFDPYSLRIESCSDNLLLCASLESDSQYNPSLSGIHAVLPQNIICLSPDPAHPLKLCSVIPHQESIEQFFHSNTCSSHRLLNLFSHIVRIMNTTQLKGYHSGGFLLDARYIFIGDSLQNIVMVYLPVHTSGQTIAELRAFANQLFSQITITTQEQNTFLQALNHRDATLESISVVLDSLLTPLTKRPSTRKQPVRCHENDSSLFDLRNNLEQHDKSASISRLLSSSNPVLPVSTPISKKHPYALLFRRLQLAILIAICAALLISLLLSLLGISPSEFFLMAAVFLSLMEAAWVVAYRLTRNSPGAQMPIHKDKQASLAMIYQGNSLSTPIPIDRTPYTIGRDPSRNIRVLNNPHISREHAVITYVSGKYYITDCHSAMHTYVNGHEIAPDSSIELNHHDIIAFYNEEYRFIMP